MGKAIPDDPSDDASRGADATGVPDEMNLEVELDLTRTQMSATELQAVIDRSSEIKSPSAQQLLEHLGHYANEHS